MGEDNRRNLSDVNGSFSGADIIANIIFPGCNPIAVGTASTITYSTYRETTPVRTISRINTKGFSKGPRTIAGTIIFTVLRKHIVNELKKQVPYLRNIKKLKPDELPPFDILFTMGNEYGTTAHMGLYGVTIVDEGKIFSIEDMFTENTWSYMARDIDLMDDIGSEMNAPLTYLGEYEGAGLYDKDKLVMDDDYVKMKNELDKMKGDRDKLIEDLRNQANEYIGNPSGWVPGQDVIVMPIGGSKEIEAPPDVDWNEQKHVTLSTQAKSGHGKRPFDGDTREVCVVIEIDTSGMVIETDVKKFKNAGVTLQSSMACSCYDNGKAWVKDWAISDKKMTMRFINYKQHAPETPTIKVAVNKAEFTSGKTTYVLLGEREIEIKNDNQGTWDKPIHFKFLAKGKNDGAVALDSCKLDLNFTATSITKSPTSTGASGKNIQFVFRDASGQALGDGTAAASGTSKPFYHTCAWVLPDDLEPSHDIKKGSGVIGSATIQALPENKLEGGFSVKATLKDKDGKPYSGKTKDLQIRCSYEMTIQEAGGKTHTIDGKNRNLNVVDIPEWMWYLFEKGGKWKYDRWKNGFTIKPSLEFGELDDYPFVSLYRYENIVDSVVYAWHVKYGCKYVEFYEDVMSRGAVTARDNCKCQMSHNRINIRLYNFKLYNKDSETKATVTTNMPSNEIWFHCENLDEPAITEFNKILGGK